MTIGPVQLTVLGFNDPRAHGAIANELKHLRDSDMVRVVDAAWSVDGRRRQENRPVISLNGPETER